MDNLPVDLLVPPDASVDLLVPPDASVDLLVPPDARIHGMPHDDMYLPWGMWDHPGSLQEEYRSRN